MIKEPFPISKALKTLGPLQNQKKQLYVAGPGGTNELHVLTTNDSWTSLMESWTKLGEDKEFAKFAEADDPTLYQLVKQFNGRTLYPAAK